MIQQFYFWVLIQKKKTYLKNENTNSKRCTSTFTTALFTTAKIWKQPVSIHT